MNSRRLMIAQGSRVRHRIALAGQTERSLADVRFGSKADICIAKRDVCFSRETGHASTQQYAA
jgi:hypothetical protein